MKYALVFLSLLAFVLDGVAVNTLSAASKVALSQRANIAGYRNPVDGNDCFKAFISVEDELAIDALKRQGVQVSAVIDGFVVAAIPAKDLLGVVNLKGVRQVSLARPLQLCNDSARILANVNPLHEAAGLVAPLTGKGVIVGVIDSGFDINCTNLCDNLGRSRVRAVYLPEDSTGTSPVVNGYSLPGSCYETPEQIALLTTDYAESSHGSHTSGTAVGSYFGNGWHGVAPEADVVLCGIPSDQFTDVSIANAIIYTFDYADRMGLPCVINMSIGSNGGPNDGSSYLCRLFDAKCAPGRLCVVSAGNDGGTPICLHAVIKGQGDTVTTLLRNQWGGLQRQGIVSAWSDGSQQHRTRLVVINRSTQALEYASPFMECLPEDSVFSISSDDDPAFAQYYTGEILFANAMDLGVDGVIPNEGGRFNSFWQMDVTSNKAGHLLGVQYVADERVELSAWTVKSCYFYTFGLDGVTGGECSGSISDLATTDSVISVGAFCSRSSYIDKNGNTVSIADCQPGDMANFSSFGPDERGKSRPDICAPGMALMSSANRYDTVSNRQHWPAPVLVNGVEYPYYSNVGTSMSAPVVTGTIALMLQVNKNLGPADVRKILKHSALSDDFVVNGNSEQWGGGKLDADAAVKEVIYNTLLPGDVNNDREVTIADVMALIDIILRGPAGRDAATLLRADVNHDSEIVIADINLVIDLILSKL